LEKAFKAGKEFGEERKGEKGRDIILFMASGWRVIRLERDI